MIFLPAVSGAAVLMDKVVAVVNQEVITWSELYKSMESDASPQLKELSDDEKRKIFRENESMFLDNLISIRLQLQEAKALGITAGDDEIREAVDNITKRYAMSEATFRESLKKEGYTFEEYRKRLREQIIISKVANQLIRSKILVTDADVEKFLNENRKLLDSGEGYRIRQIFFKKPGKDTDRAMIEEKAALLLNEMKDGGNFSELAKKYSEDPSAGSGGDLGLIVKSELIKEFAAVLAGLKPGETSAPFWTDRGLHIIKLDEKVDAKSRAEVVEEAKKTLTNKIYVEKYNSWIKGLRENSFIEVRL